MLLFCAKTMVKKSCSVELDRLIKKKVKHFGHLATLWFSTFAMHFSPVGVLFVMKTFEDERCHRSE